MEVTIMIGTFDRNVLNGTNDPNLLKVIFPIKPRSNVPKISQNIQSRKIRSFQCSQNKVVKCTEH